MSVDELDHLTVLLCVQMEAGDEQHGRPVTAQLVVVGDAVRLRLAVQKISYGARIGTMAAGTARMGIVDIRQRPAVGPLVISDSDMSSDSDKELLEVDVLADIRARLDEPVDEDAEDKAAFTSSVMVRPVSLAEATLWAVLSLSLPMMARPSC